MGLPKLLTSAIVGDKVSIDHFKWSDMLCYDKTLIFTGHKIFSTTGNLKKKKSSKFVSCTRTGGG